MRMGIGTMDNIFQIISGLFIPWNNANAAVVCGLIISTGKMQRFIGSSIRQVNKMFPNMNRADNKTHFNSNVIGNGSIFFFSLQMLTAKTWAEHVEHKIKEVNSATVGCSVSVQQSGCMLQERNHKITNKLLLELRLLRLMGIWMEEKQKNHSGVRRKALKRDYSMDLYVWRVRSFCSMDKKNCGMTTPDNKHIVLNALRPMEFAWLRFRQG